MNMDTDRPDAAQSGVYGADRPRTPVPDRGRVGTGRLRRREGLIARRMTLITAGLFMLNTVLVALLIYNASHGQAPTRAEADESPGVSQKLTEAAAVNTTVSAASDAAKRVVVDAEAAVTPLAIQQSIYLSREAKLAHQSGRKQKALTLYNKSLEIAPYALRTWRELSRLFVELGDTESAMIALEQAVSVDATNVQWLNELALMYLGRRQPDLAAHVLTQAETLEPRFAQTSLNLALCRIAENDMTSARESLSRYLELRPLDSEGWRTKAYVEWSESSHQEALESLKHAIELDPQRADVLCDAARVAQHLGREEEAITYLRLAAECSSAADVLAAFDEPLFRRISRKSVGDAFRKELVRRVAGEGGT